MKIIIAKTIEDLEGQVGDRGQVGVTPYRFVGGSWIRRMQTKEAVSPQEAIPEEIDPETNEVSSIAVSEEKGSDAEYSCEIDWAIVDPGFDQDVEVRLTSSFRKFDPSQGGYINTFFHSNSYLGYDLTYVGY